MNHEVILAGDARTRGAAQAVAAPEMAAAVAGAIGLRLEQGARDLDRPECRAMLAGMLDAAARWTPQALAEARGVAEGWGLREEDLLTFLHLPVLLDVARASDNGSGEGCSAWAAPDATGVPWLGKNRDYRGEHTALQRVFRHRDTNLPGAAMLCVGSLGAPGAFSSGVNGAGLALADTQVATRDHGPGVVRYLLMTELLATCADLDAALDLIARTPHAGGGCLVLGDAAGARAAVELGASRVRIERPEGDRPAFRTNHHLDEVLAPLLLERPGEPMGQSSRARLDTLAHALQGSRHGRADMRQWARAVMGSHDRPPAPGETEAFTGLCRHGQDGDASTISCTLIVPRERALYFCAGPPCSGAWERHAC